MPIFVIVDVEAVGNSPFSGEMTEFGAVALDKNCTAVLSSFHGVLIDAKPDPANPAVPLITPDAKRFPERTVMQNFAGWLSSFGDRVVFVSDNNTYDGMWIWYYFDKCGVDNPFGHSGRRISDFSAGLERNWRMTQKWKNLRETVHDHNPVNDAMGNAEALIKLVAQTKANRR